jgi:iron complex transport system ATP-binding protein
MADETTRASADAIDLRAAAPECPAAPGEVALRAVKVTAGYGGRAAVRELSIDVRRGELLAIVGPNGAGKSTLLRILSGARAPWSGTVELAGRPLGDYDRRAIARRVATVAQENPIAFRFTVMEVVLMGRAPHLGAWRFESARDLAIAREALDHFDLAPLAGRAIQELSGGERKRVFLARALAQRPEIALLDEPAAFLDMRHIAEIFGRFRELAERERMAVAATMHDLNTAALYADRVLLMKNGATAGYGRPEEALTAERLSAVYDTEVYVGRNPATGALAILPIDPARRRAMG